jgi:general transcription factor 3C polypeptide 3 (transcription factor C subunit 4)
VQRGGHRGARGPRKAAEPTGDIKARLGEAAKAFVAGEYTEAVKVCAEIIRINAETHEAWTTTASCFLELGHRDKALTAFTFAAHLQPKIIQGWLNCANLFLEETGKRRQNALHDAFFCYGAALAADSKNIDARLGKAKIYVERNNTKGAISEYNKVLRLQPRNLGLIRDLCAAYYDHGELDNAASLYKDTFAQFMANRRSYDDVLDWSDLDSYIAICQQLQEHNAALKELKLISRWMLRRGAENFWNDVTNDDREWDADDSRRAEIREFTRDDFPLSTYGDGLPLELRTKLGISRVALGEHEEAMVRTFSSTTVMLLIHSLASFRVAYGCKRRW